MTNRRFENLARRARAGVVAFTILAIWATNNAYPILAQQPAQQTFPSVEAASQALFQAVQRENGEAIATILGGPTELVSSHDEADDSRDRELFVQKYQEMHRLAREADGFVTLYIGAENWPFPIPLVATNGGWHFDSDAGFKEVLFRRIGENELTAIEVCHELVAAEKQSRKATLGSDPVLIDGYRFHSIVTGPKRGFGFIAYPAEYRSSGVMTFVVSENDVVYQKDLGPNTSTLGTGIRSFHKDATWRAVDE